MKESNNIGGMIKLGLILAIYAAVSCTVLALVNSFTAPKIEQNQIQKINAAMKDFFPDEGYTFREIKNFRASSSSTIKIEAMYLAEKDGTVEGGAVQVSGPTYDTATIFAGVKKDGTVTGIKFLKLTDSPGFGQKAKDPEYALGKSKKTFFGQFEGMTAVKGFSTDAAADLNPENGTFEAIGGATITSRGIGNLLSAGTASLLNELGINAEENEDAASGATGKSKKENK